VPAVVVSKVGVNLRLNGRAGKLCGEVAGSEVESFGCSEKIRCCKVRRPDQEWKAGREGVPWARGCWLQFKCGGAESRER
jgi:hypothetical protein